MKKSVIIASAFIILGLIIFVASMAVNGWDFTKLSTVEAVKNAYVIEESFTDIEINSDTTDVIILPSKDGKVTVICEEDKKLYHEAAVYDGILKIYETDTREWYDHIGIFFGSRRVTVYLPENEYGSVNINVLTGSVKISDTVFSGDIKLKSSTGDVKLKNVISDGLMTVNGTTCDVKFENIDAKEIAITVSTGDVCGTILTDKVFTAKASTGDISVPASSGNESCSIKTSTGDIEIEIAK